ncbi:Succinate-semialdehyde dehydrogenase, mitochondrial [Coemansia sp. RSA 1813]|nr:Succinate-semialdehyde dehydrogenase, mitochondrial [Coemansia sp. RSA 1843]KAJ2092226.1 Succinate-semialdehyde dehydrogenase, mitochondrial [Coemansia sp. RSA 986]KAJ2211344.1 Succinate-semialdehyde dehydrogenase, mitochondrial [Coemansia sp. RSA 487]KAJ2570300.1 Succinate-semialdehyde dehydrogenase, mitochondrial [Coemansia sp. RSA 1813]
MSNQAAVGNQGLQINSVDELNKTHDKSLLRTDAYVGGKWIGSAQGKRFKVTDPATLQTIAEVADMDGNDVAQAVQVANEAFVSWKTTTAKHRAQVLRKWYDLVLENKEDLGRIMTLECGKPLGEAVWEISYGASFLEWFSEEAKRAYGDTVPSPMESSRMLVVRQPVGVAGIITPYNFPCAMITRKVGAALAAGCTVVARPAHETPLSALALCELAERAGIPPGVINVVPSSAENTKAVGLELTTNPGIRKVSFTGSTGVGKLLMAQAASTMKKLSMELGGNAPFIVFEDADIHVAAQQLVACKFRNAGQTCVCANRIYVHDSVYDEFVAAFVALVKKQLRVGHGLAAGTTVGPMITERGLAKTEDHLQRALDAGARVVAGGKRPADTVGLGGHFFEPTVLVDVSDSVPMSCEETFGPLCPIFRFSSEDEVVRRANNVPVGLAGYFFSRDVGRIFRVAEALEVGMVGVNTGTISSEVTPFGGVKESGVGREGSRYGIDEYLNIKLINIAF